ncbi:MULTISPECIES: RecQ family ATP-dependent DNA helicase [Aliivibrio]|jgi:ATP-dependent DNA helicase RecQ|uniref:ATP-dependent DNA helicase RecQ n=1 Tax=Aliivibrio finisterrensis TaxID=511998 RepID=A0A4V1Z9C1_9GAMM|nr:MULTISPECIES: ATP-dependent DNA helicase RecQ [Aliivibrio]MDD9180065.1 RecQ family ATP-dependent DNA helicase [Aliivibrio sp. A6]RYU52383.1 RecQ family ATP-dependent DNA helicase [Aliivibrio finisterrensis]RYU54985.1 RecQ family ATP-dependent DNA helicase [Aliivibrio finisterrensis]RYU58019.1 RecQ family ATP-dependent DNA helicase [Aliivibrio finisterrensis]RYU66611.1 RecQ family ATP-dependent DNA helicase [Aliivibrio finisterrensis]
MNYQQTLKEVFGFDSLRGGQQHVIEKVLNGHSSAAIFPTGSGKSLCYQLPALLLPNLTLVISPLLALMKDQITFLKSKGIAAASIDSTQTREETQAILQGVRNGEINILMISVERLKNERFRQFIAQINISLLVVDEAHCISEWGHNFRPDYLKLPQDCEELNIPQVLLLTATATPAVIEDMGKKFNIAKENVVITGFYRPNLDISIIPVEEEQKRSALFATLKQKPNQASIVYVTLQQTAENVAQWLQSNGIQAKAYHAGLKYDIRESIQHQFMNGDINCIVATIAFGMGVDKSDIRQVIHFDLPKSIENYSQEIGRAGRDGKLSFCTVLANTSGLNVLENFVYGDTPDREAIQYVLDDIYKSSETWETQLLRLSKDSNVRQLPLKTLLVYLELKHIIQAKYSYYADYRFKTLISINDIIAKFQTERQQFVSTIFQCSPKAKTWHTVDFDALWMGYRGERKRVVAALDYFHEQGWIELESKQVTEVYQILNKVESTHVLAQEQHQLFKNKEQNEINRIHAMLDFFETKTCLSHELARYFADFNAPEKCGHCSACRSEAAVLPRGYTHFIADDEQVKWWCQELQNNSKEPLANAVFARFLCGIPTPLTTKIKANKMAGFAKFESQPYFEVLELVGKLNG